MTHQGRCFSHQRHQTRFRVARGCLFDCDVFAISGSTIKEHSYDNLQDVNFYGSHGQLRVQRRWRWNGSASMNALAQTSDYRALSAFFFSAETTPTTW